MKDLYLLAIGAVVLFAVLIVVFLLLWHQMQKKNRRYLEQVMFTDSLTGHMNYKGFSQKAELLLAKTPQQYCLLYMDMHQFKYINDTFGYSAGDMVLTNISSLLEQVITSEELFCRVYADRFVLLLRYESKEQLTERLDRLSAALSRLSLQPLSGMHFVFRCGVYYFEAPSCSLDTAFDRASYAKDTARTHFSNTITFYDKLIHNQVLSEKMLESSMHVALKNGEFEAFYQPKVNIFTREVIGAEALVRWRHPEKGFISPGDFVPFFEKNGFIVDVDFHVFREVSKFLRNWIDAGRQPVPISVNFSRCHFTDAHFVDKLKKITAEYALSPEYFELEITETVAIDNFEQAAAFIQNLKDNGFALSIDDYGAGYSSVALLQNLPFDAVKLDRSFVENARASAKAGDIMHYLVMAFQSNQIRVLCEGVETLEQEDFIKEQNCRYAQGYRYAYPMSRADFSEYLGKASVARHEYLEFMSLADFEQNLLSRSGDFLNRMIPGGILACGMEEGYPLVYANAWILENLGYTEFELLHQSDGSLLSLLHPDDRAAVTRVITENEDSPKEYTLKYRLRKKDGGYLWFNDTSRLLQLQNGRTIVLGICSDITQLIRLQTEKDNLLLSLSGGVHQIVVTGNRPLLQNANDRFYDILGHTRSELEAKGNDLFGVIYPPDREAVLKKFRAILSQTGDAPIFEMILRLQHMDDSLHWISVRGVMRRNDQETILTALCYNIDSQMETRLHAYKDSRRNYLQNDRDSAFDFDMKTGRIYNLNSFMRSIHGADEIEQVPKSLIKTGIVHPEDASALYRMFDCILTGDPYASCELRVCVTRAPASPEYILTRVTLSSIYDEKGHPSKAVGVIKNIDHTRSVAEEIEKMDDQMMLLSYVVGLNSNKIREVGGILARWARLSLLRNQSEDYLGILQQAAKQLIAPDSLGAFCRDMDLMYLQGLFFQGIMDPVFEYRCVQRTKGSKEKNRLPVHWISSTVHLYWDGDSNELAAKICHRDVSTRKQAEEQLQMEASQDPLTGLFNRISGEQQIEQYLSSGGDGALLLLELNRFKELTEAFGQEYSNDILLRTAEAIRETVRCNDIAVRMGGEEFVLLLLGLRDEGVAVQTASKLADRIAAIEDPLQASKIINVGVAIAPRDGRDFHSLYRSADCAMYASKHHGEGLITVYRDHLR